MALSHSGLTLYDQCPSAFYRRYILKEACPKREPHPNAARGTEIHADFETYLKEGEPLPAAGMENWHPLLKMLREKEAHAELEFGITKDWEQCAFDDDDAMLRGKIDAYYLDGAVGHVYEWKTGKTYAEHAHQRTLYALAVMVMFPDLQSVVVNTPYLDQGKTTVQEFMMGQLGTLKWIYERKVNKTQPPQDYPMRLSWKCRFCDYSKKANGGKCPN